ncbi:MAG TPA: glycerol-3-phosphate 1-O-acyltransferase PlsY [Bacillota bacterium]|nr:glycerol-3-phosphate 1-O-acyltransferase PlsY [Bacillota bacterium]HQD19418.1 glycerol-3-phosphate 1-O-acyltransferase PlsY [Bacillota bacterium]
MHYVLVTIYSYLLGAIPSAYIIGNIKGIDITSEGSGNIGGTNAYRVLGPRLGIIVALMDVGKVLLALIITRSWLISEAATACAVLAAVLGHNWSVYVGFRGGKGIAVSIGAYLFLFPDLAVGALLAAVFIVLMTKYVSLGSLNFLMTMTTMLLVSDTSLWFKGLGILLLIIGMYRHKVNIKALRAGTERRFGAK